MFIVIVMLTILFTVGRVNDKSDISCQNIPRDTTQKIVSAPIDQCSWINLQSRRPYSLPIPIIILFCLAFIFRQLHFFFIIIILLFHTIAVGMTYEKIKTPRQMNNSNTKKQHQDPSLHYMLRISRHDVTRFVSVYFATIRFYSCISYYYYQYV